MTEMNRTEHSRIKRAAQRASYDLADVLNLVNDCKMGHLGFIVNDRPVIIPMTLWVYAGHIYFHVANKSRLQKHLAQGEQMCVSVAECSEWVLAKSAYHHSANYRSAVLYCEGERVTDDAEFDHAFKANINDIEADRWQQVRPPNRQERKGTALMKLQIKEGSFKSRQGGPNENKEDLALDVWHGTRPTCPMTKHQNSGDKVTQPAAHHSQK